MPRTHHRPSGYALVLTGQCVIRSVVFKWLYLWPYRGIVTEWGRFSLIDKNLSVNNCHLCFMGRKSISSVLRALRNSLLSYLSVAEWFCGVALWCSRGISHKLLLSEIWMYAVPLPVLRQQKFYFFRTIISGVPVSGIVSTSVCWYCMNKWNVFTLCGIRTGNQEPPVPVQGC